MPTKPVVTFRLSEDAKALLAKLAAYFGVSRTAALELLIRERARREKIR